MPRNTLHKVARFFVALLFIGSGSAKLVTFNATTAMMSEMGFPLPAIALAGALIVEMGGGLLLLSAHQARTAAVLLIAFLVPTTLIFHVPFVFSPEQWQMQLIQVLKNLAIMGALLQVYLYAGAPHTAEAPQEKHRAVAHS